jgi:hypothetical protein
MAGQFVANYITQTATPVVMNYTFSEVKDL